MYTLDNLSDVCRSLHLEDDEDGGEVVCLYVPHTGLGRRSETFLHHL